MSPRMHILSTRCLILPPLPPPIPESRSKSAAPTAIIRLHPPTDINIICRLAIIVLCSKLWHIIVT